MKANPITAAVKSVFSGGNVSPSEPTNTPVVLASQAEPEPRRNEPEGGEMPKSNALVSDRAQALKDIYERRNAQALADAEETTPQVDESGNEVESTPAAADPLEQGKDLDAAAQEQTPDDANQNVADQPAPAAAAPAQTAPEETRTIIVDGKRMEVPLSKILDSGTRTLQKEVAADERLAQANRILAEAQRVAQTAQGQQQPPQGAVAQQIGEMTDEQLAEMIQFGDGQKAAQVIKILRQPAAVTPEAIVQIAQQVVAPQIAYEEGKKYALVEYGDLLQDPDLGAIFLQRENVARANGDRRSYPELYKAIGDDLRAKFNRPKPGAAAPTPNTVTASTTQTRTMDEKLAAKASAPSVPRLASARLDGDANTPRPKSRAEIIAGMSRARGFSQGKNL